MCSNAIAAAAGVIAGRLSIALGAAPTPVLGARRSVTNASRARHGAESVSGDPCRVCSNAIAAAAGVIAGRQMRCAESVSGPQRHWDTVNTLNALAFLSPGPPPESAIAARTEASGWMGDVWVRQHERVVPALDELVAGIAKADDHLHSVLVPIKRPVDLEDFPPVHAFDVCHVDQHVDRRLSGLHRLGRI